jgi:hypothetical protein
MAAVSASGCTADVDRDGWLDLYLTTSATGKDSHLYRNKGTGKIEFERWRSPAVEDLNQGGFTTDCTFADIDGDGDKDLLVAMAGRGPRLFENVLPDPAVFVEREDRGLPEHMNGFAVSFFDVEKDGDLDLMVTSYFGENYYESDVPGAPRMHPTRVPTTGKPGRMLPNDWGNATNGGPKHFLLNDGTGHFTEQDLGKWGLTETRFTFDTGTADINGDGWTDIYFANDFGPDQLYLNKGGETFVDVKGPFPTDVGRDSFKGMNAELADIDHDGYPEIYVTNVFHPILPEGNILWKNLPHPSGDPFLRHFENIAPDVGVKNGGWGWGAKFADLDLDGDVDLVATNGYISQDPDVDYWYRLSRLVAGSKEYIVDSTKWPDFENASMSGHQVSHVFVNDGERFFNRAADVGVTRKFDGRGVVIADFDKDGRPDVLYVPQDAPHLLGRNVFVPTEDGTSAPAWIGVVVRGPAGKNTACVGCKVIVEGKGLKPRHFEISAGNGMTSQSMDWALAGLGHGYEGEVQVTVRFLDGVEVKKKLPANAYHEVRYP